jgi:hypothetical protein
MVAIIAPACLAIALSAAIAKAGDTPNLRLCNTHFAGHELDCTCVVNFLEQRLPGDDPQIVLIAWGLSLDDQRDHSGDKDSFNLKYGVLQIDQVLRRFNRIRKQLFLGCPGSEPENEDFDF